MRTGRCSESTNSMIKCICRFKGSDSKSDYHEISSRKTPLSPSSFLVDRDTSKQEIKRGIPIPRLSHFLLLFLFAFNSLVNAAYDINDGEKDYAKEGDTALGIKLDLNFARTWPNVDPKDSTVIRNWVFSSHLKFKGLVNDETNGIEDEQLWQIALTGYNEMQANQEAYGIPKRQRSKAMTVLAFDHELILASSQKGESFSYYYTDTPVAKALERCQVTWRRDFGKESIHKN
ncbi:uncharacterized protein BO87DRAFT_386373 [Aspergillus neoniger CBS 115656]|uniref:Uncharacterized protein n=1 Tax=Aspergillus neoniger (strain CBS 115656) TaxID=1448310 RepID=A0A318Z458_ASPNB|nr:hypothetical protein BO87DRAFT_386373 [Aspergillus neoniger CBS 115656]PYH34968.1 hypothetical protein BO87DRAFT_386373 [Aspergillus neoniger CBS 115656]